MNESKPLVSIIVPCYNHEKYIEDCIWGLCNQTYDNMELFICDDNSTDLSYEKVVENNKRLCEKFLSVDIRKNSQNLGVTSNINSMLKKAKGKYIKILASDDVLAFNAIEEFVRAAELKEDLAVYVSNGAKIEEKQHSPEFVLGGKIYEQSINFEKLNMLEQIAECNNVFAPGAFVPREIYEKYGYYDETIAIEDMEYWMRLSAIARIRFEYVDKVLVYYRINENSMSSLVYNEKMEARRIRIHSAEMCILEKYRKYFEPRFFASAYIQRIIDELYIAKKYKLSKLKTLIKNELKGTTCWNDLDFKHKLLFRAKILKNSIW